jgi:hypothetical protein
MCRHPPRRRRRQSPRPADPGEHDQRAGHRLSAVRRAGQRHAHETPGQAPDRFRGMFPHPPVVVCVSHCEGQIPARHVSDTKVQ